MLIIQVVMTTLQTAIFASSINMLLSNGGFTAFFRNSIDGFCHGHMGIVESVALSGSIKNRMERWEEGFSRGINFFW